jgi:hypothetical protein
MSAWLKAGIIFGVINFIVALIFGILLPACLPPIFICLGFICGIVTALFLNSPSGGLAVKESIKAGLFSSIISTITQLLASGVYFVVYGRESSQKIMEQFGSATGSEAEKIGQYIGGFGTIACCGVTNIICFIGAAAVGALIASKLFVKNQNL